MSTKDVEVDVTVNDKTAAGLSSVERRFDNVDRKRRKSSKDTNDSLVRDAEKSLGSIEKITQEAAEGLNNTLGDVFKSLPTQAQTAIAAGIAAGAAVGAPLLVETLSTALSLGAGGTVITAGLIIAAHDPAVAATYTALGQDLGKRLSVAALPFRDQLIGIAEDVDSSFGAVEGDLTAVFANLAPEARGFADALLDAGEEAMPGILAAATSSRPLFHELDDATRRWGSELNSLFSAVAQSGPGMQLVFHFILLNIDAVIDGLNLLTRSVGPAFNVLAHITNLLHLSNVDLDAFAHVGHNIGEAGDQAAAAAPDFAALKTQLAEADNDAAHLAGTMVDKVLGATLGLDQANLGVARSLSQVGEALKDNKRKLDIHTEAGQKDITAILGAVQANIQQYDALIQAGAGADVAAAAYDANTDALERQLRKAGLTQQQVDGLIGKYRDVPDTVNTNIVMQGLADAINGLSDVLRKLNGLDGKQFKSTFTTIYKTEGHPPIGENGTIPLKPGSGFSGAASWQARADALSGVDTGGLATATISRTAGPRDVSIRNVISLDGRLFREWTESRIDEAGDRAAWRQRVGKR